MTITELRYLVAIMKNGSVSAAAKELYVAQPNVSKALKNLEEEYGLRIFERTSTGMLPTERGRQFIAQAARVLEEIDKLEQGAQQPQGTCAELRVVIPHATYASYAAADFMEQMADAAQLRVHIRECNAVEALSYVLRRGYHMALLRYCVENEEEFAQYCAQRALRMEPVMEFRYYLLTNRDGPLARREIHSLEALNGYIEVLHDDLQLPNGRISGTSVPSSSSRRVHVYERCSQFTMLSRLPTAYMWASPMPQRVLDQYHLALCRCPAMRQQMRDVLVYPEKGLTSPEELAFREFLRKESEATVK